MSADEFSRATASALIEDGFERDSGGEWKLLGLDAEYLSDE